MSDVLAAIDDVSMDCANQAGEMDLALTDGVESMSRAPYAMGKADGAISRGDQDALALHSQQKAAAAQEAGRFARCTMCVGGGQGIATLIERAWRGGARGFRELLGRNVASRLLGAKPPATHHGAAQRDPGGRAPIGVGPWAACR